MRAFPARRISATQKRLANGGTLAYITNFRFHTNRFWVLVVVVATTTTTTTIPRAHNLGVASQSATSGGDWWAWPPRQPPPPPHQTHHYYSSSTTSASFWQKSSSSQPMAANICVRGGFERFISPPGPSEHEMVPVGAAAATNADFWSDDGGDKFGLEIMPPPTPPPQPKIVDRFILRVNPNLEFHANCLKCVECNCQLDEHTTAFVKNGRTYCRQDYMRLFSTKCARCANTFERTQLVMRAGCHVFHMECFCCFGCEKRLQTGQEFHIKNNRLLCRAECDMMTDPMVPEFKNNNNNNSLASTSFDDDSWETSTLTSLDNHTTSPPLSPKSDGMRTPVYTGGAHNNNNNNSSGASSSGSSGKKKKDKQTTRVRTVLNEMQLKILKDCYVQNSRPDAMLKERLVEMTGLNARVIRVWFQNKRCKDKKRQIQMHESRLNSEREDVLNRVRVNGIGPLMVAAPTTHIDSSLPPPMDIQHYPQWSTGFAGQQPPPPQPQPTAPMMYDTTTDMTFGLGGGSGPSTTFPDFSPKSPKSEANEPQTDNTHFSP
ncbi:unnamed protein product [Caenorhabditis bovis]|uniref:Uncharacterized protein n=1 Tax=Caenorhabditis bovis TaxID=2654633 RepID=A0A8S1F9A7_9PELO|nr:unnamed protein product [Caenorhabditis bovis]